MSNIASANHEVLQSTANTILLAMFMAHYVNRALLYPWRTRGSKPTPLSVMALAWLFCVVNGYMQTRMLTHVNKYDERWFIDPRFGIGVTVFFCGMLINFQSDDILRRLRKPGDVGYKIPRGGMFRFVSGANFLGEIIEWSGFAIACWNIQAAAFAIFTFCNIAPRAYHHHLWYLSKFPDYPKKRKAVIPFIF
uniref:3-oxo-5alpha-steroid 4-dehydrogenase (NADP(+)) n=1 Tax=Hanusia phi TaxID=3032 RepID=A0A7S0HDX7_9CRYP